jgi:hypothetical protein
MSSPMAKATCGAQTITPSERSGGDGHVTWDRWCCASTTAGDSKNPYRDCARWMVCAKGRLGGTWTLPPAGSRWAVRRRAAGPRLTWDKLINLSGPRWRGGVRSTHKPGGFPHGGRGRLALPPAPSRSHAGVVARASSRGRGSRRATGGVV